MLTCLVSVSISSVYAEDAALTNLKQTGKAFATIAKQVSPAVVTIQAEQVAGDNDAADTEQGFNPDEMDPSAMYRNQPMIRRGSGFIISKDGYIVTNNHIVQNATKITVKLLDEQEYPAKLIGIDPPSDIAVLKIDGKNLPVAQLGDSDKIEVGEWVVAIGNPFGLSHSLSSGVLSAKGRNFGINGYESFLQTDAAINPGNSGGPLLDLEGKVIGINTVILSRTGGNMGIGFAIPINMAKANIDQLIAKGSVERGYFGVKVQALTSDLVATFKLKDNKGILIAQVQPDSPALKAGLKQGDIIVSLDKNPVLDIGEFRNTVAAHKPGSKHTLGILRNNKEMTIQAVVGSLDQADKSAKSAEQQILSTLGINIQNLTEDIATKLGTKPGEGVVISSVKPGSLADIAGLARGSVILEINRQPINDAKKFKDLFSKVEKTKRVLLLVQDAYGTRYIVINVG